MYVIIGGGIAGTTAAETIRARDAKAAITLISHEPHPLYSRVLLPSFIMGNVSREKVMMRTLADYRERRIDFLPGEEVARFDVNGRAVETKSGKKIPFKKLLIASGGRVIPWAPGLAAPNRVFRLQTLDDAERLRDFFARHPRGSAIVVGGGFIASELAEIFRARSYTVTFLVPENNFWEGKWEHRGNVEKLYAVWQKNGVNAILGDVVMTLERKGDGIRIRTVGGRAIEADCVVVGIGIERNIDFVPREMIASGGIGANDYLETSIPDIWVAGDVARHTEPARQFSATWSSAVLQGRIAAINMMGGHEAVPAIGAYSIGHFNAVLKLENNRASIIVR